MRVKGLPPSINIREFKAELVVQLKNAGADDVDFIFEQDYDRCITEIVMPLRINAVHMTLRVYAHQSPTTPPCLEVLMVVIESMISPHTDKYHNGINGNFPHGSSELHVMEAIQQSFGSMIAESAKPLHYLQYDFDYARRMSSLEHPDLIMFQGSMHRLYAIGVRHEDKWLIHNFYMEPYQGHKGVTQLGQPK